MTPLRYLDAEALRRALPMDTAIDAIESVMRAAADGTARAPVRSVATMPRPEGEDCFFLVMPATWEGRRAAAAKVITTIADNPQHGRATVQGVAVLLDAETGSPRLIVDASTLTTIRTGAVVGLASRFLAREHCRTVGLIGVGGLATDLVAAVAAVRSFETLLVGDARADAAHTFAERQPHAEVIGDSHEIAARADILITATTSPEPLFPADVVEPGTHINAVGNFSPTGREIDGPTVAAARRYVDDVDNALEEAGELLLAAAEGLIPPGRSGLAGDLQSLVSGTAPGRGNDDEITLFKTVGTALSDIAALVAAAEAADEHDLGVAL